MIPHDIFSRKDRAMKKMTSLLGVALMTCTSVCTAQPVIAQSPVVGSEVSAQQQKVPDIVLVDKEPELKKRAEPVYPPEALAKNLEGKVWVKVLIDTAGRPDEVQLLKSDNDIFNASAMTAARQFLFKPAMKDNRPVAVWVTFPFRFALAEKNTDTTKERMSPEQLQMHKQLQDLVREIFSGDASSRALITPEAYLVSGSRFLNLHDALFGKEQGKCFSGEKTRKWPFMKISLSDDRNTATMLVETVDAKGKNPHWHTITWTRKPGAEWKITHWHTSR
jgi:TonB family protein